MKAPVNAALVRGPHFTRTHLAQDRLPRKLVVILYLDVAGYSRLTGEDEDATHRTLSEYLDLISSVIESHRGKVMHYAGDAVLAKFEAVVDALSSAVTIQNEINTRNETVPDDQKVQFRIGVNLGDVIEDRGDIYGDGVNVAARLESLAEPGGICVSESVRLALGNKLPLDFDCMGEQEVKNIAEPVTAYRTARQGGSDKSSSGSTQRSPRFPDRPSIAVLPFANMSGDPEQEYFSDGITEDIITGLSRFRELLVIARSSAFLFKGQSVNVVEVASKLGVQYVLEGSVRKAGDQVRVTAQLIDGVTGHHLWAETYDRVLEDVFRVQDDVTQRIVATLAGRLEDVAKERALRKSTDNLSAYDCFLRGKHYGAWHRSKDNILRARAMFEKAIGLDPNYAAAYSELARTYIEEFQSTWTSTRDVAGELALEFSRKAVVLDDCNSDVRLTLASIYFYVLAEIRIHRALELNPNKSWNHCFKNLFSTCAGIWRKAYHAVMRQSVETRSYPTAACIATDLPSSSRSGTNVLSQHLTGCHLTTSKSRPV